MFAAALVTLVPVAHRTTVLVAPRTRAQEVLATMDRVARVTQAPGARVLNALLLAADPKVEIELQTCR
jgi:hypothetical protein